METKWRIELVCRAIDETLQMCKMLFSKNEDSQRL